MRTQYAIQYRDPAGFRELPGWTTLGLSESFSVDSVRTQLFGVEMTYGKGNARIVSRQVTDWQPLDHDGRACRSATAGTESTTP